MVNDDEVFGNEIDFGQKVAREEYCCPGFLRQLVYEVSDLKNSGWIEPVGGFIENQELGRTKQCQRKAKPLSHAQRIPKNRPVSITA